MSAESRIFARVPRCLDPAAPGMSDGAAVRDLIRPAGTDLRETMAVEDGKNDVAMFEVVGVTAAVDLSISPASPSA
ncbi:HAD hydrolase family protein [Streptomyces sp. NBC_01361]|uniref:HAD hydrolase family protein n=1 Tax=Streptomyces sp. NBC_01361 TaxID=2903838 RepID=UPI002E3713B4|nr:HAD hydrolase family protein [Streptomyces sp. NBC_01361]